MADGEGREATPLLSDHSNNGKTSDNVLNRGTRNIQTGDSSLIPTLHQQHRQYTLSVPPPAGSSSARSPSYHSYESGSVKVDGDRHKDLHQDRSRTQPRSGNMATLMHLIKGAVGTGLLALPEAFSFAGIWCGVAAMLLVGAVSVHCMHCLIRCGHTLCKRTGKTRLDYADVMEEAMTTGPKGLRRFSKAGSHLEKNSMNAFDIFYTLYSLMTRNMVNGLLIFTQFGLGCVYVVFIASNVKEVVHRFHPNDPNIYVYEAIVMVALMPLMCVRNLSLLAPFSALANLLTVAGLVIIFQYILQDLPPTSSRPAFAPIGKLPMFFSTAMLAVEGIRWVLPLENNMKRPEEFGGWSGVLNLGMAIVVAMYTAVGFYGYLKFGEDALGSITLNLPNDQWLYLSVTLMLSVAIYISYCVQLYVAVNIMWPGLKKYFKSPSVQDYGEYPFRIFLVIISFCVAAAVPHLDLLISLVGAFASTALAIIVPAFIEMVTLAGEPPEVDYSSRGVVVVNMEGRGFLRVSKLVTGKNIAIFLFAVAGWLTGIYTSVKAIIEVF